MLRALSTLLCRYYFCVCFSFLYTYHSFLIFTSQRATVARRQTHC